LKTINENVLVLPYYAFELCNKKQSSILVIKRGREKASESVPLNPMLNYCLWFCFCRSGKDEADIGDEQDQQEKRLRAAFVQQLLFSTILE